MFIWIRQNKACKNVCSVGAGDVREGKGQEIMKQLKLAREIKCECARVCVRTRAPICKFLGKRRMKQYPGSSRLISTCQSQLLKNLENHKYFLSLQI